MAALQVVNAVYPTHTHTHTYTHTHTHHKYTPFLRVRERKTKRGFEVRGSDRGSEGEREQQTQMPQQGYLVG